MSSPLRLTLVKDFTGGLNTAADAFKLAQNESPDMCNVDVKADGGFMLRPGTTAVSYALTEPAEIWPFNVGATAKVIGRNAATSGVKPNEVYASPAESPIGTPTSTYTSTIPITVARFNNRAYVSGDNMLRYDGSSWVKFTAGWNNDVLNPTLPASVGHMPTANVAVTWQSTMWIGNTVEGGTRHPNRIRWSHPGYPEDWVDYHYIDIDPGVDDDEIVALCPFNDHLLVFKRRSIHAVFGAPPESLSVMQIGTGIGTVGQQAVTRTRFGVFFFDPVVGMYEYTGRSPNWVFGRLRNVMADKYGSTHATDVRVSFVNEKIWVVVPAASGSDRDYVYVFDPSIPGGRGREDGAWTRYEFPDSGSYRMVAVYTVTNATTGAMTNYLARSASGTVAVSKMVEGTSSDTVIVSSMPAATPIASWYRTGWFDMGTPVVKKRWKRPEIVCAEGTNAVVTVSKMRDYDSTAPLPMGKFTVSSPGTGGIWDTSTFNNASFAGLDGTKNQVERLASGGTAHALALRFDGPNTLVSPGVGQPWGLDAITLKWSPRKVRS